MEDKIELKTQNGVVKDFGMISPDVQAPKSQTDKNINFPFAE